MNDQRPTDEQPPPGRSGGDVWLLVLEDMKARRFNGIAKYGVPVQPGNGRIALVDAYQECLDLCVYLRQAIEERRLGAGLEAENAVLRAALWPADRPGREQAHPDVPDGIP